MATKAECPEYCNCGLVKFREQKPFFEVQPLPEDGDCGVPVDVCPRIDPVIPIAVESVGPQTEREFNVTLPPLPNKSGRPHRRLHGGGHGY